MKQIIYILAIIFFGCNSNGKKTEAKSTDSTLIEQKNISTQIEKIVNNRNTFNAKKFDFKNTDRPIEDTLILKTNHKNFMISPLGMFKVNDKDSTQLKTNLIVDRAYLYETNEFYYVFFTDTDHEGATSWIQKISKNSLKSVYVKQIQGFNLGLPVIYNEFAFVSAIGFVVVAVILASVFLLLLFSFLVFSFLFAFFSFLVDFFFQKGDGGSYSGRSRV